MRLIQQAQPRQSLPLGRVDKLLSKDVEVGRAVSLINQTLGVLSSCVIGLVTTVGSIWVSSRHSWHRTWY